MIIEVPCFYRLDFAHKGKKHFPTVQIIEGKSNLLYQFYQLIYHIVIQQRTGMTF